MPAVGKSMRMPLSSVDAAADTKLLPRWKWLACSEQPLWTSSLPTHQQSALRNSRDMHACPRLVCPRGQHALHACNQASNQLQQGIPGLSICRTVWCEGFYLIGAQLGHANLQRVGWGHRYTCIVFCHEDVPLHAIEGHRPRCKPLCLLSGDQSATEVWPASGREALMWLRLQEAQ